jgi:phage I-like protein
MSDERIMIAMSDVGPRFSVRLGDTLKRVRRVPIAVLGKFQKGPQVFAITRETLSAMIANFRKQTAATVIDYEHASCEPEIAKGQPIPAAGWIEKLDDEPDSKGILWGTATFSERAAQMLNADEVRYFSPVIEYRRDKRTGVSQGATLVAGALTLRPFLDGMPAIAMSEGRR